MLKAAGTSPAPEPGADDADGSHEASEADRPGMASKWAQRVDVIAIQNAAERRRLTVRWIGTAVSGRASASRCP